MLQILELVRDLVHDRVRHVLDFVLFSAIAKAGGSLLAQRRSMNVGGEPAGGVFAAVVSFPCRYFAGADPGSSSLLTSPCGLIL